MLLWLIFTSTAIYVAWCMFCLEANVRAARKMKLPVVRIPIDVNNNLWVMCQPLVWHLLAQFPIEWAIYPDFVRFCHRNWHFLEKSSPIERFGPVWALASPGGVHLHVSDPEAIQAIFSRWRDFFRPIYKYQMLSVYGDNVFTVGPEDWPRHRKAVAKPLHEVTMEFVWHESLRQTSGMLQLWTSNSGSGTSEMIEDLRDFSLNVLTAAAYSKPSEFKRYKNEKTKDNSFRDAMSTVQRNAITVMITPKWLLSGPFAPRGLAKVGHAATRLGAYMTESICEQRKKLVEGEPLPPGLMASLCRESQLRASEGKDGAKLGPKRTDGLSTKEVLGNLFMLDFAGYDTTANALSFILMLLAANPSVQDWVAEEINATLPSLNAVDWDYNTFPELKRCQSLFLETLRLYPPITAIPKIAIKSPQTLRVGDGELTIPPGTETFPLLLGVQTDATHWADPHQWKPSRWVIQSKHGGLANEEMLTPEKGTFFPFSDGPQGCVGKKFAQVEGTAMLACLLRQHRVRARAGLGETEAQARKRAEECVNDVNYHLLLKMNQPERVNLECFQVSYGAYPK